MRDGKRVEMRELGEGRRKGVERVNNASGREWEPESRKWGQPKAKVKGERDSSG